LKGLEFSGCQTIKWGDFCTGLGEMIVGMDMGGGPPLVEGRGSEGLLVETRGCILDRIEAANGV
jgi:hypothetical protein